MAFQNRPNHSNFLSANNSASSHGTSSDLGGLVDQIAEAVRTRLLNQGVPLSNHAKDPGNRQPPSAERTPEWKQMLQNGAVRIGHTGETPFQAHVLNEDQNLAGKIDHTLLKPDATPDEIKRMCSEAAKYHFATVCVNSANIGLTAELLKGTDVKPIAVVGFPLGAASSASKGFEAREAVKAGAREIDMVINIGAMKGGDYSAVLEDIKQVVDASKPYPVKVILETSNLTRDEKIIACALSKVAGAAFVKTSTGFGTGGATAEDVHLMRQVVGPNMGVKASGGIRTYEDASKMIEAGASRIGASASIAIVTKKDTNSKSPKTGKTYKGGGY